MQTWNGNMGPFSPVSLKGNARIHGVPTFIDKLPLTIGGIASKDVHFGRVVSIVPGTNRREFVEGIPTGGIVKGIAMLDPTIMVADPAMNNYYFAGKPMTAMTMGLMDVLEWDLSQSAPVEGSLVWANNTTGLLAFTASTTTTLSGYTKLNAHVYESFDPNGAKVWFDIPFVTATSETVTATATPTATPAAGAVDSGTGVILKCTTPGATIFYTQDGTTPSMASKTFNGDPIFITAACTIKAIAIAAGHNVSGTLSAAYTLN